MNMKMGDVLIYKDVETSVRYGTGVVISITTDEYSILWSGRGMTRYRRAILDGKLDQVFQRTQKETGLPKERHLHLGPSKIGIPFNVNYDRSKVELLCEQLKLTGARKAIEVADGLAAELFTKKLVLRGAAKNVLLQLAELCGARGSEGDEAKKISMELFFGYVLQKTDFKIAELED